MCSRTLVLFLQVSLHLPVVNRGSHLIFLLLPYIRWIESDVEKHKRATAARGGLMRYL